MKKLVNKYGSCLAWWKALKFAPANDKIIKISYPIYMEAYSKVAVSIMAKIYAWGTKYCLIDIPVWKHWKIHHLSSAKKVKEHFEYIWKHLWMKIAVVFSNADAPVWRWVWAVFQCRESLRILQNKEIYSEDIREKSIMLSAKLIELVWLARWKKARQLAEQQLLSWAAWEYMKKLIVAQNAVHQKEPNYKDISYLWVLDSEDVPMAQYKASFISDASWIVKNIDVENLKSFCRILWAPFDKQAWFYLTKQVWDKVKKWEVLCEFYSNDRENLNKVIKLLWEKVLYETKK
jgi:thymidine phosphorylase